MKRASVSSYFSAIVSAFAASLLIHPKATANDGVDYLTQIKPILSEKCYSCHGAIRQESGLRLETRELLLQGGDSGPALVEQHADISLILERVSTGDADLRMPPEGEGSPLSAEQLDLLTRWINAGAPAPPEEIPASPNQHWAFQPVTRPAVPVHPHLPVGKVNPIDAFIAAGQASNKLKPVAPANRSALLRRVYLDLTGLPPTVAQQHEFLNGTSPDEFEKLVDQLLASPQHGERWGRHWMDIWRYTDWYGLGAQLRNSQKHIWHWRDWIIESLNADKGYDQMVREMLAADELYPTDADKLRGTGFLARHYYLFNRTTWLDDTIEHTSKAFLGLTMNCVKCHSHKYDPISHEDYYAMRAFFEPYQVRLDAVPGETDLEKNGLPRIFDAHPDASTFIHVRGDEKNPDRENPIQPHLPAILTSTSLQFQPIELPATAVNPALRTFVLDNYLENAESAIDKARHEVIATEKRLEELKKTEATKPTAIPGNDDGKFIEDEFDNLNTDVWDVGPGQWSIASGQIVQNQTGAARAYLRTKQPHPQDFIASLKFTTTGGDKWRSVGLAFDVTGTTVGQKGESINEKMIYLSAVEGGSKLQVSFKTGGNQVYPAHGAKAMPVALNSPYEMTIAIRGQLVNVALNGEHKIAFQLPVAREAGVMDLVAFDATVNFDSISIRSLSDDHALIPALKDGTPDLPMSVKAGEIAVRVARLNLAAAELFPITLKTAFAADRAKAGLPVIDAAALTPDGSSRRPLPEEKVKQFVTAAAKAAREFELAQAELKLAQAETKPDDAKALHTARESLAKAQEAVMEPGENYTSLTASLKALEGPDETDASRRQPYPQISTGRRSALAKWMTDRQNPLTARVAINHISMRHFRQPLVETQTDFGLRAKRPVQDQLLDWLAAELMENSWSMKRIHRLIVTSRTWQLSTSTLDCDATTLASDPDNAYYWRRKPVRMESQVVRDSIIQLAGMLDLTMGGPSLDANAKSTSYRRSLYFKHSRDDQNEFLAMFDDADILRCYRRSESVVPQQALALANSELALSMARRIAAVISTSLESSATDEAFVHKAFETVLCRQPTPEETGLCIDAMSTTRSILTNKTPEQAAQRVRENLVHTLVNHNDFVTVR